MLLWSSWRVTVIQTHPLLYYNARKDCGKNIRAQMGIHSLLLFLPLRRVHINGLPRPHPRHAKAHIKDLLLVQRRRRLSSRRQAHWNILSGPLAAGHLLQFRLESHCNLEVRALHRITLLLDPPLRQNVDRHQYLRAGRTIAMIHTS